MEVIMNKVMLFSGERNTCNIIEHTVRKDGFDFCCIDNKDILSETLKMESPDLAVLDITLSDLKSYSICDSIRGVKDIPIILLLDTEDIEKIEADNEMHIDDYLAKPFSSLDLSLRIKALLFKYSKSESNKNEE